MGILELEVLRLLVEHGIVPVCAGGGGVPVARGEGGALEGVEAVVDKDRTAALLARELQADLLVLLTDVEGVFEGFGTDRARLVQRATPAELRALDLPAGSMAPKAEACIEFVDATGREAAIGSLEQAADVVAGTAGTRIVP